MASLVSVALPPSPAPLINDLVALDVEPAQYVDALQRFADQSRAARHPLLAQIAVGEFAAPRAALERLFREYYGYSRQFTRFLSSAMSTLERPEHRAALIPNSAEEAGQIDPDHVEPLRAVGLAPEDVARPHPELFRRFLLAIGLAPHELDRMPTHVATATWIHSFHSLCRSNEAAAIGAIGIATEGIVRGMYQQLLAGIRLAWPDLSPRDRAFFELHALVDDDHAATLRDIAIDLAADPVARRQLAVGVLGALDARAAFYDQMSIYLEATRS